MLQFNMLKIYENVSLKRYNGYSVNVKARYLAKPSTVQDLQQLLDKQNFGNHKKFVLGQGFNTLFANDIPYLVILNKITKIAPIKKTNNHIYVKVGSGVDWIKFVRYATKRNWGGDRKYDNDLWYSWWCCSPKHSSVWSASKRCCIKD